MSPTARDMMVENLEAQLIGESVPGEDPFHDYKYPPYKHYIMGVLHPLSDDDLTVTKPVPSDEVEESGSDLKGGGIKSADEESSDVVGSTYQQNPSSLGVSLFLKGVSPKIRVRLKASVYEGRADGSPDTPWKRRRVSTYSAGECHEIDPLSPQPALDVLENRARLRADAIQTGDGWVVTVSLCNQRRQTWLHKHPVHFLHPKDFLFQVGIRCEPVESELHVYPTDRSVSWDEEEDDLRLLYRDRGVYGMGHGCSVEWDGEVAPPRWIGSNYLPRTKVPDVTFDIKELRNPDVLKWQYLASADSSSSEVIAALKAFIDDYRSWISTQCPPSVCSEDQRHAESADRIRKRLDLAAHRMEETVGLLENPDYFKAFRLANEAMLMQRVHLRSEFAGGTHAVGAAKPPPSDYFDASLVQPGDPLGWRPFQLAFILLVLPSLSDPGHRDRDLVDLLWFPTGGGKTEAYFGLIAFEIFRRRIIDGVSGLGTVAIKRYTYRVLTFQQFERASSLIAACEILRTREKLIPDSQDKPVTIGLWVGGAVTPNNHKSAFESSGGVSSTYNPYQISRCPWCGTTLLEKSRLGFEVDANSWKARCPDPQCAFHDKLPVEVVDTDLYRDPPSLLLGTIDKFTALAYREEAGALLGQKSSSRSINPPSLIIQDELHLISGPLGTLSGSYEAALDLICESRGARPKYIGATATLRRSATQCRALYGRDSTIFPPTGMSIEDSFFMRVDPGKPGRLYVGVMGQGHTPLTSFIHASAALAHGPTLPVMDGDFIHRDGYGTQVIYHNSRRELGKTMTAADDDIPKRMGVIAHRDRTNRGIDTNSRMHYKDRLETTELSGQTKSADIPGILDQLDRPWKGPDGGDAVDLLATTSILSVGVDKARLGLMLMNGQPKTTAEYIQASSRVGRGEASGLVVTLLSQSKPRDRSHYETFVAYHESLYRQVEPVSVTPYARPARARTMPAAFVASVRHASGRSKNHEAADVGRNTDLLEDLRQKFFVRCAEAQNDLRDEIHDDLLDICNQWMKAAEGRSLKYNNQFTVGSQTGDRSGTYLLRQLTDDENYGLWVMMNAMRLVDVESGVKID